MPRAAISSTRIRAVSSAAELPKEWDAGLDVTDLFVSARWLAYIDEAMPGERRYLLAEDDHGNLVAGLPCYRFERGAAGSPFMRLDATVERLTERAVESGATVPPVDFADFHPALICGGRQPHSSIVRRRRDDPSGLDGLLAAAEDSARSQGCTSVAFPYVSESDEVLAEALRRRGYVGLFHEHRWRLSVPGGGFDAYLAALDSRQRHQVRRDRRRLGASGVRFAVEPLSDDAVAEMVPLEVNLNRKYDFPRAEADVRSILERFCARWGDAAVVSTARSAGRLRGFALFVRFRGSLYSRDVGFDYDFQGKLPIYFGVLFYEPLAFAQREGVEIIDYGAGSDGAKRKRGCRALGQHAYARSFDPRLQRHLERLEQAASVAAASGEAPTLARAVA